MGKRPIAPAALLLLAACGGGSEGSNTADGNESPPTLVQEKVPENLTDDAGNESIPLEPPPAQPAKR